MAKQVATFAVRQDVGNCLQSLGVVNGNGAAADRHDCQVGEGPFRAVGGQDRDLLLWLQVQGEQAVGKGADLSAQILPADVLVAAMPLAAQGGL